MLKATGGRVSNPPQADSLHHRGSIKLAGSEN